MNKVGDEGAGKTRWAIVARRSLLGAAILILGMNRHAEASDACDGFKQTRSLPPQTNIFFTSTNFAPGDHIMGSITGTNLAIFYLRDESTGMNLTSDKSNITRIDYTVSRSTANHTINIYINNYIPALPGNSYATLEYSFSCRSAKPR